MTCAALLAPPDQPFTRLRQQPGSILPFALREAGRDEADGSEGDGTEENDLDEEHGRKEARTFADMA